MNPLKKYIFLVDTVMRAGDKGLTLQQIADRWNADDEMHDSGAFAPRSFHRHRREIQDLFGIEIECYLGAGDHRYRVADDGRDGYFRRWLMDSIAVNRIVADSREAAQHIAVEPCHDEALPTVLEAMKGWRMMRFDYRPYWADRPTHYFNFRPHALRMFERRWYVIGRYRDDMSHLVLALDRMEAPEVQEETFVRDPDFDQGRMFRYAYGIIAPEDAEPPETVRLRVEAYQANYLRSLPLHESQIELRRTDKDSIFVLKVHPTFDFRQKLLSLGSTVEVLRPESLRQQMREEVERMREIYCLND